MINFTTQKLLDGALIMRRAADNKILAVCEPYIFVGQFTMHIDGHMDTVYVETEEQANEVVAQYFFS